MINRKTAKAFYIAVVAVAVFLLLIINHEHVRFKAIRLLRGMSINLGGGMCEWTPPVTNLTGDTEFFKTLIAGYPSGDKRLTFVQMEALTELPAKDEWDFAYLGMTNHPFIKANYPHHEGIWSWGQAADQTVMVVRNIRRALTEYHDILWDIGYAKTWADAFEKMPNLYQDRPPMEDWLVWREERVMDEIDWYGWFIDYYMEGGLMRDMFTHKITTPEHWNMIMMPTVYTRAELEYDRVVGSDTVVTPSYDPHCINDMPGGCEPVLIISGERLVDHTTGPAEGLKLANIIEGKAGMSVIGDEARHCIWEELIIRKKGLKTFIDREGYGEYEYNFPKYQLALMVVELNRLITKYESPAWSSKKTAQDLVDLLIWHRDLIQEEIDEM